MPSRDFIRFCGSQDKRRPLEPSSFIGESWRLPDENDFREKQGFRRFSRFPSGFEERKTSEVLIPERLRSILKVSI